MTRGYIEICLNVELCKCGLNLIVPIFLHMDLLVWNLFVLLIAIERHDIVHYIG